MKALFLGLGSIGQRHLRNLKQLKPDVEVHAVRRARTTPLLDDNNQVIGGVNALGEAYQIIEHEFLDDALNVSPDLVFVTNPSNQHSGDTKHILLNSNAIVFVEKPVSHDLTELAELIDIEKHGRKRVMVGFQLRFNPLLQHVKRILDASVIGNVVSASFINSEYMPGWHPYEDYRNSYAARGDLAGGALLTQIHDFDYATWLLGSPGSLYAVGGKLSNLEIDVEDSVNILMSRCSAGCEQPAPVNISLDYLGNPANKSFKIIGDLGQIVGDLLTGSLTLFKLTEPSKSIYDYSSFQRNDMFINQLRAFLAFASDGTPPPVGLEEAQLSLRLALLSRQSMQKNEMFLV